MPWTFLASLASAEPVGCFTAPGFVAPRPDSQGLVPLASELRPVVVWYDPAHANSVDIADDVIANLELAWDVQVDGLGFREPVLPDLSDGPELDVYLIDYQPWAAFVIADSYQLDPTPGDGFNGAPTYMVIDRGLPARAVPSYVSHEFQHVTQYATDFTELTLPIWEGVATAAQKWTVGDEGFWDFDVPSFQEVPSFPALTADGGAVFAATGKGSSYEYGSSTWVMFLDEKHGVGDGQAAVALWQAAANEGPGAEPDVVDAFAEIALAPLPEALAELALVRFLTGPDWDERGLADAAAWGPSRAVPAASLAATELPYAGPVTPPLGITGQGFVDIDLSGAPLGTDPWLVVTVDSPAGLESSVVVMWWDDAGGHGDAIGAGQPAVVELPATGLVRVALGISNAGPPGWDGDDDAYVPGDQTLAVALEDRFVPPVTTATTLPTTTPPAPLEPDPVAPADAGGCGCRSGGPGGAGLAAALLLALRRRQRL